MNKNYTLKELADIGAKAARGESTAQPNIAITKINGQRYEEDRPAREAFAQAILNAIGYEFPVDAEREAFAKWWATSNLQTFCNAEDAFKAWKAGREELRKEVCSDKCEETKTEPEWWEPEWITWHGGDKSPIIGQQTKYEVECRSGLRSIWITNSLRWSHTGSVGDIIAYRILD